MAIKSYLILSASEICGNFVGRGKQTVCLLKSCQPRFDGSADYADEIFFHAVSNSLKTIELKLNKRIGKATATMKNREQILMQKIAKREKVKKKLVDKVAKTKTAENGGESN